MGERPRKKICVQSGSSPASSTPDSITTEEKPAAIDSVPQEDTVELFKFLDLRTRYRLRRVSRYWKHLLTLPLVNEIVLIDRSCLLVSDLRNRPTTSRTRQATEPKYPLMKGWFHHPAGGYYGPMDSSRRKVQNMEDHQRCGLMGPHVRVLIYQGPLDSHYNCSDEEKSQQNDYPHEIRSIGLYCTNVQHIVLHRVYIASHYYHNTADRSCWYRPESPPKARGFADLVSIALSESILNIKASMDREDMVFLKEDEGRGERMYLLEIKIPRLVIDWSGFNSVALKQLVWPFPPAQRDWVARYARQLPQSYQTWAAAGAGVLNYLEQMIIRSYRAPTIGYNLQTADYSTMPVGFLRIISSCILHERIHGMEPPPYDFQDRKD